MEICAKNVEKNRHRTSYLTEYYIVHKDLVCPVLKYTLSVTFS